MYVLLKEPLKKITPQDKGTDWTYYRSFDVEVKWKGGYKAATRTLTLTKESTAMFESNVKTWYEDDGRNPPKFILASAKDQENDEGDSDDSEGESSSASSSVE